MFSVKEAALRLGIHEQTLREYDKKGLLNPKRDRNNCRLYSAQDLVRVTLIASLTGRYRMNLNGVKVFLRLAERLSMTEEELLDFIETKA